jgi:hypothetical protein
MEEKTLSACWGLRDETEFKETKKQPVISPEPSENQMIHSEACVKAKQEGIRIENCGKLCVSQSAKVKIWYDRVYVATASNNSEDCLAMFSLIVHIGLYGCLVYVCSPANGKGLELPILVLLGFLLILEYGCIWICEEELQKTWKLLVTKWTSSTKPPLPTFDQVKQWMPPTQRKELWARCIRILNAKCQTDPTQWQRLAMPEFDLYKEIQPSKLVFTMDPSIELVMACANCFILFMFNHVHVHEQITVLAGTGFLLGMFMVGTYFTTQTAKKFMEPALMYYLKKKACIHLQAMQYPVELYPDLAHASTKWTAWSRMDTYEIAHCLNTNGSFDCSPATRQGS